MRTMKNVMKKRRHLIDTHLHKQVVQWQACSIQPATIVLQDHRPVAILAQHMMAMMTGTNLDPCSMWYGLIKMIVRGQPGSQESGQGVPQA